MTTSDNDWYNELQRVVQRVATSSTTSYNEWQRMTTSDNEWCSDWQRVIQRMVTNDNGWQRDNEWYN